jgi:hypothetical protein
MQAVLAAGRGESWARTAVDFGSYDESHMINDIRARGRDPTDDLEGTRPCGLGPVRPRRAVLTSATE